MKNTDPPSTQGVNPGCGEGEAVPGSYKTPTMSQSSLVKKYCLAGVRGKKTSGSK